MNVSHLSSTDVFQILLTFHFVSDFLFQTDEMAINKSSSNKWLSYHVAVYSALFVLFFGPLYGAATFVAHFITDYYSSRATTKLFKAGKRHWFFVVIGADQLAHMLALWWTYLWFAHANLIGW